MTKYVAALACCLALAGCGEASVSNGNPLIKEAQRVGDEAPPPNNELPSFNPSRRSNWTYIDDRGPGAEARRALRQEVIGTAGALRRTPCDAAAKKAYIQAFRDYAAAKLAMQRTQTSYGMYWKTSADKQAVSTIDDLVASGHITQQEQASAVFGATPQGLFVMAAAKEGEPEMPPVQAACRDSNAG